MKASITHGVIINTGSVETYGTTRGNAHYTAAKGLHLATDCPLHQTQAGYQFQVRLAEF